MLSIDERKKLFRLQHKKYRHRVNKFIVEGVRVLEEALKTNRIEKLYYSNDLSSSKRKNQLINDTHKKNIPIKKIPDSELREISNTISNQGILGVVQISPKRIPKFENNCIYLDEIRDPGNVGTIFRTADWFGVHEIVLSKSSVDPYNPKVVRSGMGAHFRINIHTDYDLKKIKSSGYVILAADTEGNSIQTFAPTNKIKWCLIMGSEGDGISKKNRCLVDNFIAIPGSENSDSLNVGVATGILLNHLTQ
tara:strand:+ start:5963 stop:6712 length:750 start_codon:yes stop_codon:yes gene_type:complete